MMYLITYVYVLVEICTPIMGVNIAVLRLLMGCQCMMTELQQLMDE
jgi:hypothetical protein